MRAWGVDGCKGGWFYVGLEDDRIEYGFAARLSPFVAGLAPGGTLLVDMPIGLGSARECDRAARRMLSPRRHSSVFSAPCRSVLAATDYADALRRNRADAGTGISKQTWNIVPKIAEVDALLATSPAVAIREAHPEVCFAGLAGTPMEHAKRTTRGADERLAVLDEHLPHARETIARARSERQAALDDIIDATVLAYCALRIEDCATLPENPEADERGLPMEMVYLPLG